MTHPLIATQRLVRSFRKMASDVADAQIAAAKQLATVKSAKPFTVIVDGSSKAVAAHHLNSYTPFVGDRVAVEIFGRQIIVLGKPDSVTIPVSSASGQLFTSIGDGSSDGQWSTLASLLAALNLAYPARSAFNWSGAVVVPSGGVGDIGPDLLWVPTGIVLTLVQVFAIVGSGTSATVALQQNGSNITGLSAMVVAPFASVGAMTYTPTNPTVINNGDRIKPLVGSVSGSPVDLVVVACYTA